MALLHLRFFAFHASYYPLEVLHQARVQAKYVLVDRAQFPAGTKVYSQYDVERQGEDQRGRYLPPRYQKFRGDTDPFQYHKQLLDISLA
jgi:hypothetical protein